MMTLEVLAGSEASVDLEALTRAEQIRIIPKRMSGFRLRPTILTAGITLRRSMCSQNSLTDLPAGTITAPGQMRGREIMLQQKNTLPWRHLWNRTISSIVSWPISWRTEASGIGVWETSTEAH